MKIEQYSLMLWASALLSNEELRKRRAIIFDLATRHQLTCETPQYGA